MFDYNDLSEDIIKFENELDIIFNEENIEKANNFIAKLNETLKKSPNYYLYFLLSYTQCFLYHFTLDKELLKSSEKIIEASIKLNNKFGLSYIQYANILGLQISSGSNIFIPIVGMKLDSLINKGIRFIPNHFFPYLQRGISTLFKPEMFNGGATNAIIDFEKSLSYKNNNPEAYAWLGICFSKQGKKELAIDYLKKAISLKNSFKFAQEELAKITT
ncbi:MAG: hypothetical protein A2Y34_01455 [Spirochaetes bacterium GWC1_27_15]|nr:MAG: hypothetical protein A2Z98_07025 [Spirochaetes bacterium GWB1_27_13]OHD21495.1 MAG: hypothetical protein A2Y34_01455 [Spirochaetes bacterium GWC1_27_15]